MELLQSFLDAVDAEYVFLVGDIVDLARLRRRWYWPASHRDVLRRLLDMSHQGTQVCYLPGNHDGHIRDWDHFRFGDLRFAREHIHKLADGRRLLITHGDSLDWTLHTERLLGLLGGVLYAALVGVNHAVAVCRSALGYEYWSLADAVKRRIGKVGTAVGRFQSGLVDIARQRGCEAVLAGHVHVATIERQGDTLYCNTGDWVDSRTAIVEDMAGELRLVQWTGVTSRLPVQPAHETEPLRAPVEAGIPAYA